MQRAVWNQNQMGLLAQLFDWPQQFIKELLSEGGINALAAQLMAIPAGIGFECRLCRQGVRSYGGLGDRQRLRPRFRDDVLDNQVGIIEIALKVCKGNWARGGLPFE